MKLIKITSLTIAFLFCNMSFGAPVLDDVKINPPAVEGWIISPTTGTGTMTAISIKYNVSDLGVTCDDLVAGIMVDDSCQVQKWPKGTASPRYQNTMCSGLPDSRQNITVIMDLNVAKNANGAPIRLCGYNKLTGQLSTQNYRLSYGEPIKNVSITSANYSSSTGNLRVQGNITAKGNTKLDESAVQLIDGMGSKIGSGTLKGKKFDISIKLDKNPDSVSAIVVRTKSKMKNVRQKP